MQSFDHKEVKCDGGRGKHFSGCVNYLLVVTKLRKREKTDQTISTKIDKVYEMGTIWQVV